MSSYLYKGEEWGVEEESIPILWKKYGLLILYDGYNVTTGQRIHVVLEGDTSTPKILDNALIVTVEYFNDNFKRFTE